MPKTVSCEAPKLVDQPEVSCKPMWDAILATKEHLPEELFNRLADAFTDFECAWDDHCLRDHADPA